MLDSVAPAMHLVLTFFAILAVLLLIQSLASLVDGFRFLRMVRAASAGDPARFAPPATVIVPVKGADAGLEANLRGVLRQDYPAYDVIFTAAGETDPAWPLLRALAGDKTLRETGRGPARVSLVCAGYSAERGEKVHNLLRALESVNPASEVLVFADADATPGPRWLGRLAAALGDPEVTVSTGFRWYLPGRGFASQFRAAWDTSIATMLGEHGRNFAWGGSMAIRRVDFERLRIREKYWARTVSDDYALTRAVGDAGGRIRFEPRCLLASREELPFRAFVRWANRQIILTRVYAPRFWWPGFAAHILYAGTLLGALGLLFDAAAEGTVRLATAAVVVLILALGMAKGRIRSTVARELFPEERETLKRFGNCYWLLAPLVPWVMLWNFLVSAATRRIEWRGVCYLLRSDGGVEVSRRRD